MLEINPEYCYEAKNKYKWCVLITIRLLNKILYTEEKR